MPWILQCARIPALYTRAQVQDRVGLRNEDDVSRLVQARLLPALGGRGGRQQLWFWAEDVERLIRDRRWVERVVRFLYAAKRGKGMVGE